MDTAFLNDPTIPPQELMRLSGAINGVLRKRGITRSENNPISDYTEWLVSSRLGLTLADPSVKGYDATGPDGVKYEIKARRITSANPSRQLSAIRDLEAGHFDYLVAVVYSENFDVQLALKIPRAIVAEKARWAGHTNSHSFFADDSLAPIPGVEVLTDLLNRQLESTDNGENRPRIEARFDELVSELVTIRGMEQNLTAGTAARFLVSKVLSYRIEIRTREGRHNYPHFHVIAPDYEASYRIDNQECLAGSVPRRHERRIQEWAADNRGLLENEWRRAHAFSIIKQRSVIE